MTGRYDCCPGGRHREDALCSRTSVLNLPPEETAPLFDGIPEAMRVLADEWVPQLRAFNASVQAAPTRDGQQEVA